MMSESPKLERHVSLAAPRIDADLATKHAWRHAIRAEREAKQDDRAGAFGAAADPKQRPTTTPAVSRATGGTGPGR